MTDKSIHERMDDLERRMAKLAIEVGRGQAEAAKPADAINAVATAPPPPPTQRTPISGRWLHERWKDVGMPHWGQLSDDERLRWENLGQHLTECDGKPGRKWTAESLQGFAWTPARGGPDYRASELIAQALNAAGILDTREQSK